jgi:hypothetical protein
VGSGVTVVFILHCNAKNIGYFAYRGLSGADSARIIGITSKGVFLLIPDKTVTFVSFDKYRSPLTITLNKKIKEFPDIYEGMNLELSPGKINFKEANIDISYTAASIWYPPLPPKSNPPLSLCLDRLINIARGVVSENRELGLRNLLEPLLNLPNSKLLSLDRNALLSQLHLLQLSLKRNDVDGTVEILNSLLGMGRGLTPSGDDLIIGLLLLLNRWGHVSFPAYDIKKLNQKILAAAGQRTTAISENLISCAAQGNGDERLLYVLDGLFTGECSVQACVSSILDLGNSSGIDALVGMATVLTASVFSTIQ